MQSVFRRRPDIVAASTLFLLVLAAFFWRSWHALSFSNFGDETGHFVGARVIASGGLLYRDFVDEHGPLIYAIPQLYGALFGWADPAGTRIVPVALLLLTAAAMATSPALRGPWERITAPALFIGLITSAWIMQALFMVNYQPLAGMLLLTGLAQFTVPAWYGTPIGAASLYIAGFAFALSPFAAFSYGPAAILLLLSGLWAWVRMAHAGGHKLPPNLNYLLAGSITGITLMALWLAMFADARGYVVYHFIAALKFYGPYLGFGYKAMFSALRPKYGPSDLVQALGIYACIAAAGALLMARVRRPFGQRHQMLPIVLGVLGVILTNPRGSQIFQDGAFIVVAFGLAALTLTMLPRAPRLDPRPAVGVAGTIIVFACIAGAEAVTRHAVTSPHMYTRAALAAANDGGLAQSNAPWAVKVRQATDPDERILAVPFFPQFYPLAGRLPMKGYYIYLPWDADYARHPTLGVTHDLCADLARDPPIVIRYDGWVVWGKYDPRAYMPCFVKALADSYVLMPGEVILYVRKDRRGLIRK